MFDRFYGWQSYHFQSFFRETSAETNSDRKGDKIDYSFIYFALFYKTMFFSQKLEL